jgi:hypothetical protein
VKILGVILLVCTLLIFTPCAQAQNVQMECRTLVANDFLGPDEVIVNDRVCHSVRPSPSPTPATATVAPTPAAAVAPVRQTPPTAASTGKATVILYRPSRLIDASRKATIYVDNRPLCVLTNNTNLKFELPAGPHSLSTLNNRQTTGEMALPGSQFNLVGGQTYYFTLTNHWLIFAVSAQQGES